MGAGAGFCGTRCGVVDNMAALLPVVAINLKCYVVLRGIIPRQRERQPLQRARHVPIRRLVASAWIANESQSFLFDTIL